MVTASSDGRRESIGIKQTVEAKTGSEQPREDMAVDPMGFQEFCEVQTYLSFFASSLIGVMRRCTALESIARVSTCAFSYQTFSLLSLPLLLIRSLWAKDASFGHGSRGRRPDPVFIEGSCGLHNTRIALTLGIHCGVFSQ